MKHFLIIILILLMFASYYIYHKYFIPKSIFQEIKLPLPLYQP